MDTEKKHTLKAIVITACCLLLAGACEKNDRIDIETPEKHVPLAFNASIANTAVMETKGIIPIEGFTEDSYNFGISITKSNNEVFKGSGDMTATMSNPPAPGEEWSWILKNNANSTLITDPKVPTGRELQVIAYYSADKVTNAFSSGIPFDFIDINNNKKQTEILYNTNTAYTALPEMEKATIPLRFQHAYSRIVINVTKYIDDGTFNLSSVSIDNLAGEWIKNSGKIDPKTGLVMPDGATAGPISEVRTPEPLHFKKPVTYEFLVPSFMDPGVNDANLIISMMINGIREVFILNREHLNKDGNSYGFRQGYKNTYNLVFNNSRLNLTLLDWTSVPIDGYLGSTSPIPGGYLEINLSTKYWMSFYPYPTEGNYFPPKPQYLKADNHIFESFLTTVNYGNNGDYIPAKPSTLVPPTTTGGGLIIEDDENIYKMEKVYPILQVTKTDISIESIPWEDENGQLVAKEICKKYNGEGKYDWRLPRAGELRAIMILSAMNGDILSGLNFNLDSNTNKPYWTATEVNENEAWSMFYSREGPGSRRTGPNLSPLNKKKKASVRCVREAG